MFSAAASRTAGSGEPSVSVPSTSRMTPRRPLLTLTLVISRFGCLAGGRTADRIEQADIRAGLLRR